MPTTLSNYANITGGRVRRDVLGILQVQRASGGSGGSVESFQVDGSVLGDIDVPEVSSLKILTNVAGNITLDEVAVDGLFQVAELFSYPPPPDRGNVSGSVYVDTIKEGGQLLIYGALLGDLTVATGMEGGRLEIDGHVGTPATPVEISIADMASAGGEYSIVLLAFGNKPAQVPVIEFHGNLELSNGVPEDQYVQIGAFLLANSTIDLNGDPIAGTLSTSRGGNHSVVNGGAVTGTLLLAADLLPFAGTATVASVGAGGQIVIADGSDHAGSITVEGNNAGTIRVGGSNPDYASNMLASASITIGGAHSGLLSIEGLMEGEIDIASNATGDITMDVAVGRVVIDELLAGELIVARNTAPSSLIAVGGIEENGDLIVNNSGGDYDADGTIHVGLPPTPPPLGSVVFDGRVCIRQGPAGSGDNNGVILCVGCHADTSDLDICIGGTNNGAVQIVQTGCSNQVSWSCTVPCVW